MISLSFIMRGKPYNKSMDLFGESNSSELGLLERLDPKYRPVFESASATDRVALTRYFLPHRSRKAIVGVTRPRVLKWYCPFADQRQFPTGHRYCINVYTGCEHRCRYCYAAGYEPDRVACKQEFENKLLRDLADLDTFDLPPAPVHLSNSTDPFQPMEQSVGQTRFALEQIARHRNRFSTVVLLTKNPCLAAEPAYLDILKSLATLPSSHPSSPSFRAASLPGLRVEISLAFWRDEMGHFYDPAAPSITARKAAIAKLRRAGIPVILRIDPLLPRDPLPLGKSLAHFGLPDAQPLADLENLVQFAADQGVMHIVYSVAKIIQPRFKPIDETMAKLKTVYQYLASPSRLVYRGGSHRLPDTIAQQQIVAPLTALCRTHQQEALFCKENLLATP